MKPFAPLRWLVLAWVGSLVLLPLAATVAAAGALGFRGLVDAVTAPAAVEALWLSAWTGCIATLINVPFGTAIAWMIVRWRVAGHRWLSALVDLPLSIPTLVVGILLVALYGPASPLGGVLEAAGVRVAYARPGIVLALLAVTLPFVVRAVEPVLAELDPAEEEAAVTLGARPAQVFWRVLLPPLLPAMGAGGVQVFARSVAEFGSLSVVSGNILGETLVAPVYVLGEVEAGNPGAAAAVSVVLLAVSLTLHPLSRALSRAAGAGHV